LTAGCERVTIKAVVGLALRYMISAKLKLDILLERKSVAGILPAIRGLNALDTNLFIDFFFLHKESLRLRKFCNFLVDNILSRDSQLFLENRGKGFSKIICA
jgi:hypothetical protein